MHDVIIAGGGPGGLYAAQSLARQGLAVCVLEEHQRVGEPVHCTGILADDAFDELDLSRRSVLNSVSTARFYSPRGETIEYATRRIEAVVIDRRLFDEILEADARAAGVTILHRRRVTGVTVDASGVSFETAVSPERSPRAPAPGRRDRVPVPSRVEQARARAAILACGASYGLQRRLGLGMPAAFLQSAQMELPAERLGDVELHFGAAVAPKGFAWAVPVRRPSGPHVRVGVMCERDAAGRFRQILGRIADRWGVDAGATGRPRQKMLPLAPIRRTYADRLLVVGDAAGLVKATTGGGIYYSVLSGAIAADVLGGALRRGDAGARALRAYEARWRARLDAELQAQLSLRLLAQRLSDADIERLFTLAKTNGVMPIVRRTASFNRHRRLILALLRHPPVRHILFRTVASAIPSV
jgi:digeranylgeranylglycerophospholipid reductase